MGLRIMGLKPGTLCSWLLLFFGMDQLSKWGIRQWLTPFQSVPLIPNVFHLTLTFNTGAAFSLLRAHPEFLTGLTACIFVALLAFGFKRRFTARVELLSLSLILGGALGNLVDRILWGRVTDFLDVVVIRYPVFNLADTFIFCGVMLYLAWFLSSQNNQRESLGGEEKPDGNASPSGQ